MKFNYRARTKNGEIQEGVIEAFSKEAAISILQKYGLYITILKEVEEVPFYAKKIEFFERISQKDLVLFSRQLSIMFGSKVTLIESLRTLASQIKNSNFREKIIKISDEIEGGTTFSLALSKHPKIFSPFYVAMVRSGEVSGKLSEVLDYLAEHLEREYHLASRIKGVMIYPTLVFSTVLIVLTLMLFFVLPHLTEVLKQTQQELPTITQMAIILADFLRKWGLIFILILIVLIIAVFRYYKSKTGKEFFHKNFLKLPLIGPFLKLVYLSRFAENLSTLISSGLPITQCLEITGEIIGNSVYQEIILQARDEVKRGEPIFSTLARFPEVFPPVFTQMTLVGERTGTLDKTLMNLASFYQKETERTANNFLSVLEPLLIIFLGVIVGGLIAAFLIPLYQMTTSF
ncbi:MAG: type II secretion system F family protein [Patescibacteria group bacterium]|nr:type II secretion system F family protein [Patescibacteria group bacterium]